MTFGRIHMDVIFRRRLYGYRVSPPDDVWGGISEHLRSQKRRKRVFYLRMAASFAVIIAAGALLFTQLSGPLGEQQSSRQSSFSNFVREPAGNGQGLATLNQRDAEVQDITPDEPPQQQIASLQQESSSSVSANNSSSSPSSAGSQDQADPSLQMNPRASVYDALPVQLQQNNNLEQQNESPASAFDVSDDLTLPKNKYSALSLKAAMSPVMSFRHVQGNSGQYNYNTSESRLFSYSGGVNFGIRFSERLTVRSGVYYSQLGQTLSKIVLGSDDFARAGEDVVVKLNNSLGEVQVKSRKLIKAKPPENIQNIVDGSKLRKFSYTLDASVIQRFEYLRIPLLLEYKVVDKRMDVNVVGGLHSNFLVNEGVYLKDDAGAAQQIGNTSNINRFNYSGSFALGLEYALANHVNMYFEPTVDYFLNPINQNVTKTYPYSFAVYTGLSISF